MPSLPTSLPTVLPSLPTVDADRRYVARGITPQWIRDRIAALKGLHINHVELLAALVAQLSFSHLLSDRQAIHFIDNVCALSVTVHGYSGKPDMATIAVLWSMAVASNQVRLLHEYVPSEANIADIPSRPTWSAQSIAIMDRLKAEMVALVFPSKQEWDEAFLGSSAPVGVEEPEPQGQRKKQRVLVDGKNSVQC